MKFGQHEWVGRNGEIRKVAANAEHRSCLIGPCMNLSVPAQTWVSASRIDPVEKEERAFMDGTVYEPAEKYALLGATRVSAICDHRLTR